jgi:hypothetical protein
MEMGRLVLAIVDGHEDPEKPANDRHRVILHGTNRRQDCRRHTEARDLDGSWKLVARQATHIGG